MSYILDALKKAEAERQHGSVPNIHAQKLNSNALSNDEPAQKNALMWVFLIAVVIVTGAIVLFIIWPGTPPAAVLPVASVTPASAPAVAAPVVAAPAQVAPPVVVAAVPLAAPGVAPPPALAAVATAAPPAPVISAPVLAAPTEPVKAKPQAKPAKVKKTAAASASDATQSKKTAQKQSNEPPIETITTTLRDLPPNLQNEIPPISVGGYIYSDNRAECQLLINKMLLHEGEQVAPGLVLERMMAHSAILNYKGYRYRISY